MSFFLTGTSRAEPICPGVVAKPAIWKADTSSSPTCVTYAIESNGLDIFSTSYQASRSNGLAAEGRQTTQLGTIENLRLEVCSDIQSELIPPS